MIDGGCGGIGVDEPYSATGAADADVSDEEREDRDFWSSELLLFVNVVFPDKGLDVNAAEPSTGSAGLEPPTSSSGKVMKKRQPNVVPKNAPSTL